MNFDKLVTLVTFFRICNMPQDNSKYYKSKTKTQTVKCRVCLAVCLAHNYQSHLKTNIYENASDLRHYGEVSLAFTMNNKMLSFID